MYIIYVADCNMDRTMDNDDYMSESLVIWIAESVCDLVLQKSYHGCQIFWKGVMEFVT